jgi:hypothetical protein
MSVAISDVSVRRGAVRFADAIHSSHINVLTGIGA